MKRVTISAQNVMQSSDKLISHLRDRMCVALSYIVQSANHVTVQIKGVVG
jgi:hypothetical protein